ncbi:MAG: hypothetical protein M8364_18715 [Methylobacter sp.]|uniref:hypothetical protein n=1 Tax=Methylobacter sp. TaxID=2051955 RepID=UPI002585CB2F|nr:hypothetical protein [Methylobacter sp.]MCL7422927.1 hypothetical protein [Methylobacter sp.]
MKTKIGLKTGLLAVKNFYRPIDPKVVDAADLANFPELERVTADQAFGGWANVQKEHFDDKRPSSTRFMRPESIN